MKRELAKYFFLLLFLFQGNTAIEDSALPRLFPWQKNQINSEKEVYKLSSSSQNEAFILERLSYTTTIIQLFASNRIVRNSIPNDVFNEHQTTSFFNQYSFKVSNILIRFRRKALIFPFQYFW